MFQFPNRSIPLNLSRRQLLIQTIAFVSHPQQLLSGTLSETILNPENLIL
jgi:hypothetical protein